MPLPHTSSEGAPATLRAALLGSLALVGAGYLAMLLLDLRRRHRAGNAAPDADEERLRAPTTAELSVGFVTNFFDTLGIGSFAPTAAAFRAWRLLRDEYIPGTLNVGHTLPAMLQAFIFIRLVPVDAGTLAPMIGAAMLGAWTGARVVAGLPRHHVRVGMGAALLGAAGLMLCTQLGLVPGGGTAMGLAGARLAAAVGANLVLGALMTLGIGLYAPCMIVVSLLGMDPRAAFPIMMGSCAFLMPVAGARFVRRRRYAVAASLGLLAGGIPAVLLAAFVVKSLPLRTLRWLVIAVVLYTGVTLLRAARRQAPEPVGA